MPQRMDRASILSVGGGNTPGRIHYGLNKGDRDMHGPSAVGSQASAQYVQVQAQNPQQKQTAPDTKQASGNPDQKTNPKSGNPACGMNMDVSA